jgi:hypothetical protein
VTCPVLLPQLEMMPGCRPRCLSAHRASRAKRDHRWSRLHDLAVAHHNGANAVCTALRLPPPWSCRCSACTFSKAVHQTLRAVGKRARSRHTHTHIYRERETCRQASLWTVTRSHLVTYRCGQVSGRTSLRTCEDHAVPARSQNAVFTGSVDHLF